MSNFKNIALVATTALTLVSSAAFASGEKSNHHHHKHKHEHKHEHKHHSNFYAVAGAGINMGKNKYTSVSASADNAHASKNTARFLVGAGYKCHEHMRADLTLSFGENVNYKMKKSDGTKYESHASSSALMANGYYHFMDMHAKVSPYATAGLGMSFNHARTTNNAKAKKTDFAWQVGAGVSMPLMHKFDLDLGYRYTDFGKINIKNTSNVKVGSHKLTAHSVMASIRVAL